MEIRSNSNPLKSIHNTRESVVSEGAGSNHPGVDKISIEGFQQTMDLLGGDEEVRADALARGKELAATPDYPPQEIAERIARLLLGQ